MWLLKTYFNSQVKKNNVIVKKVIQDLIRMNRSHIKVITKRQDIGDNEIDIDYTADLKPPPFQKLELDETDDSDSESEDSDEDNGAEESVEKQSNESGNSKQDSASNGDNGDDDDDDDDDNDSDYDDVPGGDGQGGGILGLLAGLSGVSLKQSKGFFFLRISL